MSSFDYDGDSQQGVKKGLIMTPPNEDAKMRREERE
jgi:hypothetical protein